MNNVGVVITRIGVWGILYYDYKGISIGSCSGFHINGIYGGLIWGH